jgi:hypothetical protein
MILYRYIMFGRGICKKYQSRDEKFPEPNSEGNSVSSLVRNPIMSLGINSTC